MGNFIHDIEITNFKSIRHQKIEGCKRINVFIGYPNVGKSNILEAIGSLGIVEKILENRRSPTYLLSDFIRLENLPSCFFQGIVGEGQAAIRTNLRTVTFEWEDFTGTLRYTCMFEPHLALSSVFNSRMESEYVSVSDSFLEGAPSDAEILSHLQGHVYRYMFKSFHQNSEGRITKVGLQFPFGENIASSIQLNPNLKKAVSEIFSDYGFEMVFENGNLRLFKKVNSDTIFSLGIQSTADTLQRFIFHKAAIATNKESVLLFEEPEADMFPPFIKSLTYDIISSKTNQYFIATHSPFVLDTLMEDAADELSIYLVDYVDGETKIQLLSQDDLKEIREYGVDLFFNIESYLKRGQSHSA